MLFILIKLIYKYSSLIYQDELFILLLVFHLRCIDGYSRKIIWLECASSNNNPAIIAHNYMNAVVQYDGCPWQIRTDCGTENVHVAAIQAFINNRMNSHVYGTSPANQRIESWWTFLRRNRSQWWICLFEGLVACGSFTVGHLRETDCLRFCFMSLIRLDLSQVMYEWNTHQIRPSAGAVCPAGIPDILFLRPMPLAVDCLVHLPPATVMPSDLLSVVQNPSTCSDNTFAEYMEYLCFTNNWSSPDSTDEALQLYFNLRPLVRNIP